MVVYIYRWKIKKGYEQQFKTNWGIVTRLLRDHAGSYGSRLHSSENGDYVAYAQWPSVAAREGANVQTKEMEDARRLMKESIRENFPAEILYMNSDYLI